MRKKNIFKTTMKRIVSVITICCIFFSIVSCSSNPGNDRNKNNFASDYSPGEENLHGNTVDNMNNGGIATQQGRWIYYISSTTTITKENTYTGEKSTIFSGGDCIHYLSVCKDYLYFISNDNLYRIRTDGQDMTFISDTSWYYMYNCKIYFTIETQISALKTVKNLCYIDTENISSEPVELFSLGGGEIVVGIDSNGYVITQPADLRREEIDYYAIRVYNIETGEMNTYSLEEFGGVDIVSICDGTAYCFSRDGKSNVLILKLSDMSATTRDLTFDNYAEWWSSINCVEDNFYLCSLISTFNGTLHMLGRTTDGLNDIAKGQVISISDDGARNICIAGDWIFYVFGYGNFSNGFNHIYRIDKNGENWSEVEPVYSTVN